MIDDIKQAIVSKLVELYSSHTIYDEDIPQNFKTPSFLITLIEQEYRKRINTKYNSSCSFDVAYFSNKDVPEIKADCLTVQETLLRGFDFIGAAGKEKFRVLNKVARITDNVLHITFEVSYSEMIAKTEVAMQTQETNSNLKED